MTSIFLLSFDPLGNLNPRQLEIFIRNAKGISEWHSPFSGTYFIKSNQDQNELNEYLSAVFASSQYVLSKVEPGASSGLLPESIWLWLNRGVRSVLESLTQSGRSASVSGFVERARTEWPGRGQVDPRTGFIIPPDR
ncbi:hypothetical protein [Sphingomonas prati]|uniref:Uncharacterized protein n=1 Tax=Sphingomonas prati TaxID=1843237 RepID=A0A7W9BVH9_9SPHN|nr:hypothetical protein [Sphingomonas prati]MBB5730912.1 hypothetical protein [Sphingomonas prati]